MIRQMLLGSLLMSTTLFAQNETQAVQGSDTLAGYMSDLIIASGLEKNVVYQGGGSGVGEAALLARTQHLAPMSRPFKPEQLEKALAAGIKVVEHVIGLDGVGVFVHKSNTLVSLTLDQVKKIFSCEVSNWSQLGGPDLAVTVYRRNDASGTTDTFKSLLGLAKFGSCVKVLAETSDIAAITSTEASAVGYSGLSAKCDGNHDVALAKDSNSRAYAPSPANIRSFNYPLARRLYIYEAAGLLTPAEQTLLDNALDRSFSDPILIDNEFFTVD